MTTTSGVTGLTVPFFRASIGEGEINEVVECLRSGWLTTGPRVREFEKQFAEFVGAKHAVAVNSCTAALHLAVEALGLGPGQAVIVPSMTFAATAEIVRYQGAIPLLVDCDSEWLHLDLEDAERKIEALRAGKLPFSPDLKVVGIMPVHVAGIMLDMDAIRQFANRHKLWVVEDAAHSLPAAYRSVSDGEWRDCGSDTADVTCFSFYANKTITTGEGGMAVTADEKLAARIRQMSLHGLSQDAWKRYQGGSAWDYRIMAPGYKYNLTDIAAAIGLHQLTRAEEFRQARAAQAETYTTAFSDLDAVSVPKDSEDRIHSWHLYPIRLHLDRLTIDRNTFKEKLRERGVNTSVHWRPLHLHPYYQDTFGWTADALPVSTAEWQRLLSLPLFPDMTAEEQDYVIRTIHDLCGEFSTEESDRRYARRPR